MSRWDGRCGIDELTRTVTSETFRFAAGDGTVT